MFLYDIRKISQVFIAWNPTTSWTVTGGTGADRCNRPGPGSVEPTAGGQEGSWRKSGHLGYRHFGEIPISGLSLVGGLDHEFYFSIYWECHHPNWLSYFSEGFKPPTRSYWNMYIYIYMYTDRCIPRYITYSHHIISITSIMDHIYIYIYCTHLYIHMYIYI